MAEGAATGAGPEADADFRASTADEPRTDALGSHDYEHYAQTESPEQPREWGRSAFAGSPDEHDGWNERRHDPTNGNATASTLTMNNEEDQATTDGQAGVEGTRERFEAVALGDERRETEADDPAPPESPAATTSPLDSASLASTAATTAADSTTSTSNAAASPSSQPQAGPSSPTDPKPAAAAQPKAKTSAQKKPSSTRTVMQQVVSFTRQRNLPPKNREEEEKHLQQLAEMQAASQEADRKRRAEMEARTAARNATLANAFPDWERHILPNWRIVFHNDSQGRYLRKLWWNGTMPVRWRGRLWSLCIGNGLALPKSAFGRATTRAQQMREAGQLEAVEAEAKEDARRTLPALKLFQEDRVMHDDLMELLLAWSVYEKRTPRYAKGLAFPAAMLLLNMPPPDAFVALVNLVHKSVLRSFYSEDPEDREAYFRVFDTLLADYMPKVYANFSSQVVRPSLYLAPWLSTMYIAFLPLDLATRVFDVFLLEGDSFAFRVALVLLQILEPRLFNPNLDELAAVFEGTDTGAVGVVRREKGLLTADGGSIEETDEGIRVETEDVYAEMGATEERVFARLGELEWKEETWSRLVERELPDEGH